MDKFQTYGELEAAIVAKGFHWFKSGESYGKSCDFWRKVNDDRSWNLATSYGDIVGGYTVIFH